MEVLVVTPARRIGFGALALAAGLAVVTARSDPAGQLLSAPACLAALAVGLRDLRRRPLLRADGAGLTVLDGWRRVTASWQQVERMRVVKDRRTELLELDLGTTMLLLPRSRLGRSAQDVLDDLLAIREVSR